ncbi:MAG: type II secretion protein F, partial [Erysipelotrichaceae bacterium]
DQFKKLCVIGIQASSFNDILKEYLVLQMNLWNKKIKRISVFIQIVAYSFVGIMVILMYQVMLLPLNMIEEL